VLSISILVFGFGAAALLRTAHEEFASAPAWRPAPETRFAQAPETPPVLALLRVDDAPVDASRAAAKDTLKTEPPALSDAAPSAAADPAPSPQPDLDKTAALQPTDTASPEAAKAPTETAASPATASPATASPAAANPPQAEATTAPAETSAVPEQIQVAATEQPPADAPAVATTAAAPASDAIAAPVAEAAPVAPAPTSASAPTRFSTKIATLGGPPVDIAKPKAASAKPGRERESSGVKKRQAHRAVHRRRIARRAALQRQQAAQQQLNPFGQVTPAQ
jgi:hypothetical protein